MKTCTRIARREMLSLSAAGLALVAALPAWSEALRRTPAQTSGPFYPRTKPADQDADLTHVAGRDERAAGQIVELSGRVLNIEGQPVAGARIEIWQANTYGRYTHPRDDNPAPLDPNFEGYALLTTDEQGRYGFRTIKPGAYPAGRARRPPHIHFEVRGKTARLVTQMYFPGEPLNESDSLLRASGADAARLIAQLQPGTDDMASGAMRASWDIVLQEARAG